jgi:hypothetical protein
MTNAIDIQKLRVLLVLLGLLVLPVLRCTTEHSFPIVLICNCPHLQLQGQLTPRQLATWGQLGN